MGDVIDNVPPVTPAAPAEATPAAPAEGRTSLFGATPATPAEAVPVAPVAPVAPTYEKMVGADGAFAENWRDLLPEEMKNEKCFESVKTLPTLLKNYVNAQHMIGMDKIAKPGKNATPEELGAFYNQLGRPEKADGYKLEVDEKLKGLVSDNVLAGFQKTAHELGLSQAQYEGAVKYQLELANQYEAVENQRFNEEMAATEVKLKSEYGDKFNEVMMQANKAADTFGLHDMIEECKIGNKYSLYKALAKIGESISESKLKGNDIIPTSQSRLNDIMADTSGAYYNADDPRHEAVVQEVNNLLNVVGKNK